MAERAGFEPAHRTAIGQLRLNVAGLLLDHVATDGGATAEELIAATGWQRHSVRGALSRLRSQGFATRLEVAGDRKAYRLVSSEA